MRVAILNEIDRSKSVSLDTLNLDLWHSRVERVVSEILGTFVRGIETVNSRIVWWRTPLDKYWCITDKKITLDAQASANLTSDSLSLRVWKQRRCFLNHRSYEKAKISVPTRSRPTEVNGVVEIRKNIIRIYRWFKICHEIFLRVSYAI